MTALAVLLTSSCGDSGGGARKAEAPKPGSPSHDWFAANESWKKADYSRTMELLARLSASQGEYRDKAKIWQIALAGGVAQGYNELADEYAKSAKIKPEYRRNVMEIRNAANMATMQFVEAVHDTIGKNKDTKIAFEVPFPAGSAELPMQFGKITKGLSLLAADHQAARDKMVERGVIRFAAALAGPPGDLTKASEQFAAPPRDLCLTALAKGLLNASDLYDRKKLDVPQRGNILAREAAGVISLLPDSKEKKELDKQAQEALKKFRIAS
jgi:hypothetical protein